MIFKITDIIKTEITYETETKFKFLETMEP